MNLKDLMNDVDFNYEEFVKNVKEKFIPETINLEKRKKTAKNFNVDIHSCLIDKCQFCHLKNSKNNVCLSLIIQSFLYKKVIMVNFSSRFMIATEFYLKYYCTNFVQEEMDI